ncbi:acyltransferase [Flagellimonas oceanensis]|uniref:acyltransferase n=1 Tax=Flagellimonas oceanensis TaxID=2499163 RepID=UPI000F8D8777|nr:acyltransferase [Allomuricauda oceanensis]
MFVALLSKYYSIKARILGFLVKLLFSGGRITIGKNFACDSIPRIIIDKNARLVIGDNVIFRRNVEIRCHNSSKISIGGNCRIDRGVRILSANESNVSLGYKCRVGLYTVFNGGDNIEIGENTLISGFVYLQTSMHNYEGDGNINAQGYQHAPIKLGKDCWLGTHAVVFPGVVLGPGCVVGTSSVVNKSFDKNTVVAGIPAKELKKRNTKK